MKLQDWSDMGVFPLQDWREGIVLGRKMTMAGARVSRMTESGSAAQGPIELATERAKGTIGDIHPWLFVQTADRTKRPMGAWTMGHAAIAVDWQTGGYTGAAPINGWAYRADLRFEAAGPLDPVGLPRRVKGQLGSVWPSMRDDGPSSLWLHGDPRLVCPQTAGPYDAGTLVCDLQPSMELCMDGSTEPGVYGRHARLQSMMRVIAFQPGSTGGPLASSGNGIAWNLQGSMEGLMGLGMCWANLQPGTPGVYGPTTPGGSSSQQSTVESSESTILPDTLQAGEGASYGSGIVWGDNPESASGADLGDAPNEFGQFQPNKVTNSGVIFMASHLAGGPIHGGCTNDKHNLGADRDGHPLNAAHISTKALYYDTPDRDGPFLFGGYYPNPGPLPLTSRVHLVWDRDVDHQFAGGSAKGVWRWYAEVPHIVPGDQTPPGTPSTPTTPGGGGGRGPTTPGGPGPGRSVPPPTGGRRPRFEPMPGRGVRQPAGASGPAAPGFPPPGGRGPTTPGGRGPGAPAFPTVPAPGTEPNPYAGIRVGPIDPTPKYPPPLQESPMRWNEQTGQWERQQRNPKTGRNEWYDENGQLVDIDSESQPTVGSLDRNDRNLFSIHHPFFETYSSVGFRPQLNEKGAPNFERNRFAGRMVLENDEQYRPQVASLRSWGAQVNGDWKYTTPPEASRNRGGVVRGGIILSPPDIELDDYLHQSDSSRTNDEIENPEGETCFVAAPGTCFAFGVPVIDGGLGAGAVSMNQEPAASAALLGGVAPGQGAFRLQQLDSDRAAQDLLHTGIDQATDEIHFRVGGTAALTIPRGSDAQRPAAPVGGEIRISNSGTHDVFEIYDAIEGAWREVGKTTQIGVKNTSGGTLAKGTPVYAVGSVGASGEVEVAAADASNASTMPAIGLLQTELANNAAGHAVVVGVIGNLDTSGSAINATVYVASGGGLTTTRPTSASVLVQNIGRVVRVHGSTGEILVMGAGRTNDVPNSIPVSKLEAGTTGDLLYYDGSTWTKLAAGSTGQVLSIDVDGLPYWATL